MNKICPICKNLDLTYFILLILIIVLNTIYLRSENTKSVKINFDINDTIPSNNTPLLFGQFIEFLNHFINGEMGLWAQEFKDRGLDRKKIFNNIDLGICENWDSVSTKKFINDNEVKLIDGGYNLNGKYYQKIKNKINIKTSIFQKVYNDNLVKSDLYFYLKVLNFSDSTKFEIIVTDTLNKNTLFVKEIDLKSLNENWSKIDIKIPNFENHYFVNLHFNLIGIGELGIDEVSLMEENNIHGIKKDFFDLLNNLKPGIFRYPGGEFADNKFNQWENTIEHIDQRNSPNGEQRMDFGLDQFLSFCKLLKTEPFLVCNQDFGTLQDNLNILEYCNGDSNSIYGKLRRNNGHINSYNVKYWSIGNEQWGPDYKELAVDFKTKINAMKTIDPNFKAVIWGNYWGGYDFFNDVMKINKYDLQNYSHHILSFCYNFLNLESNLEYLYSVSSSIYAFEAPTNVAKWLKNDGYFPKVKQSLPEWWTHYELGHKWLDSSREANRIENAIASAQYLNSFFDNSETVEFANRTTGLAFIRGGYNKKGKRVFYGTPSYYVSLLYRNHFGDKTISCITDSEKYSLPILNGMPYVDNQPFVNCTITRNSDSIYLHIINKYPNESINIIFDNLLDKSNITCNVYSISSDNILDENSSNYPDLISIKETQQVINKLNLTPHSVNVVVFSIKDYIKYIDNINTNLILFNNIAEYNVLSILSFSDKYKIELYSYLGIKVLESNLTVGNNLINISEIDNGLYFVKLLENNNNLRIYKFIKK